MTLRAAGREEPVLAVHAGLVPNRRAWDWQKELIARRSRDEIEDVFLTLEHPRVFTAGRRADPGHVLWSEPQREARGIELYEVDRGGDVTYHGPGQLVGYPIIRLEGIRAVVTYVRQLEEVCIRAAADFGLEGRAVPGLTGVWVGDRKLVAIGVRVTSRGVTSHGFAFNVTTDLGDFGGIVPCGISDKGVCSLASLGVAATVDDVLGRVRHHFADVMGCTVKEAAVPDLGLTDDVRAAGPPPDRSAT